MPPIILCLSNPTWLFSLQVKKWVAFVGGKTKYHLVQGSLIRDTDSVKTFIDNLLVYCLKDVEILHPNSGKQACLVNN